MPKYSKTRTRHGAKTKIYHWTKAETFRNAEEDNQTSVVIAGVTWVLVDGEWEEEA